MVLYGIQCIELIKNIYLREISNLLKKNFWFKCLLIELYQMNKFTGSTILIVYREEDLIH